MGNIEVTESDSNEGAKESEAPLFLFFPDAPGPEPADALRHVQNWAEKVEADHQRHQAADSEEQPGEQLAS